MNRVVALLFLLCVYNFYSQHTFSIVAVDTITGEIVAQELPVEIVLYGRGHLVPI